MRSDPFVDCVVCGHYKAPLGRSIPLGCMMCSYDCEGYLQEPFPSQYFPGERDELGENEVAFMVPCIKELQEALSSLQLKYDQLVLPIQICPYCKVAMEEISYKGYYDTFDHWECNCYELPNARTCLGAYA